jgi:hypothetical protein
MPDAAFTGEVLFGGILAACLFDYLLFKTLGNDYTISWTLLGWNHPIPSLG